MTGKHSDPIHHADLARTLEAEITDGRWQIGDRFPTEAELQDRFEVGRYSVRKALKVLTERGLIARRRKAGSFVTALRPISRYVHSLRDIRGLTEFGQITELTVSQRGFVSLDEDAGPTAASGRYYRVAGLRHRTGEQFPVCWSDVLVAEEYADVCKDAGKGMALIYEAVMERFALKLDYVEQSISSVPLKPGLARMLDADTEASALVVERRYVDSSGHVFEISRNIYPGERYVIKNVFRER